MVMTTRVGDMGRSEHRMRIGEFARLGQVSIRMLRHYEALDLLIPQHVDRFSGHRSYSVAQLTRLNRIMALSSLGISLKRISVLLDSEPSTSELVDMLTLRRHQLQTEQEVAAASLAEIEFRLALIERTTMKFPDCVIKELPAERIIGTTVLLGEPPFDTSEIGPLFGKVAGQIIAAGGDLDVGVGLYSDSEAGTEVTCGYRMNSADGNGLNTTGPTSTELDTIELPPCTAATLIHEGSMSRIGASWQHLSEWCLNQGYSLNGPCREIYLEEDDGDGSDWVVELQQPITR
ncbi:MAG: MerR family transcriptional regulator [Brevibacterium aurantiacum]|uniref:MerR family transcriptional regulator n=2 Tax=Brevibacterium aurantiacum TaxID=273384 RepID=UPI003F918372